MILRDRDVVNVDVLLADQVEQQIERPFVDVADGDGKREVALFFLRRVLRLANRQEPATIAGETARIARKRFLLLQSSNLHHCECPILVAFFATG